MFTSVVVDRLIDDEFRPVRRLHNLVVTAITIRLPIYDTDRKRRRVFLKIHHNIRRYIPVNVT